MAKIARLNVSLDEFVKHFARFTKEDLRKYDWLVHDGDIVEVVYNNYTWFLEQCLNTGQYPFGTEFGVKNYDARGREIGQYRISYTPPIAIKRLQEPVRPGDTKKLREELDLAVDMCHGFKKIRWALDRELKGNESDVPDLGHPSGHYVHKTYETLVALAHFQNSGEAKPFVMGLFGPSARWSNRHRKIVYKYIDGMVHNPREYT